VTVRDLIAGAFRLLGVLAAGENPQADETQDALASLNDMIEAWKLERLMVFAILPQRFNLVPGKKSYTLGPGGDFSAERPVRIDQVSLIYTLDSPFPLSLPIEIINLDQYQALVVPDVQSTIPQQVYPNDDYPLRTLSFYPVPTLNLAIDIFTWKLIDAFADVNQTISLPPGYARALRFNLALELADEYGKQVPVATAAIARDAKAAIKSANSPVLLMRCDDALTATGGTFDWRTGQ
jgi:hypothetical protein